MVNVKKFLKIILVFLFAYVSVIFADNLYYKSVFGSYKETKMLSMSKIISSYHKITGKEYLDKSPIMLFGCSIANGYGLEKHQTPAYKLSEITKRTVHNFSIPGYGLQAMLYALEEIKKDTKKFSIISPEYVIYIFIDDHARRLYVPNEAASKYLIEPIKYKVHDGKLKRSLVPFKHIQGSYFLRAVKEKIYYSNYDKIDVQKNSLLIKKYFEESKSITDTLFPNSQFIILLYEFENSHLAHINSDVWNDLKKEGFIIIRTRDIPNGKKLIEKEYKIDEVHPSEKAWDIVIQYLAKYIIP